MADKDRRYFFAVGQKSFEAGTSKNYFSTVVPIADASGEIIDDRQTEFPNRGRAWWMLRGEARVTHAPPGCLIMSGIRDAAKLPSSSEDDHYQLLQPKLPGPKELLEILTPDAGITDPNELLDDFSMRCDHEPTRHVLVRIGDDLYGPLKVELMQPENDRLIEPEIRFRKPVAPPTVYRIAATEIAATEAAGRRPGHIRCEVVVQRDASRTSQQSGYTVCYDALTGALYEELREGAEEVDIVSLQAAVRQVSRDLMSRNQRREFLKHLDRYANEAQSSPTAIRRVQHFLGEKSNKLDMVDQIYDTLVSDERFKPKIDQAVAAEVEKRVDVQAAQIKARANEKVATLNAKLSNLEEEYRTKRDDFKRTAEREREALEQENSAKIKEANEQIKKDKENLRWQERALERRLNKNADKLSKDHLGMVTDFLALQPLLERLGLGGSSRSDERGKSTSATDRSAPALNLPKFPVVAEKRATLPEEESFFKRFVSHVEECGFVFNHDDLLAFHLSAKERAPVILGGVSGSGKSSLPVLYAEALAGDATDKGFLAVDVNPSWTSSSDLFGYTDALEHRFVPAASGMLNQMILAYHARTVLGPSAPTYLVCLEELNLAQPEHYLADIIQAISRAPGNQLINIFDPRAVRTDDPFRPYAHLELSPNLIIVGTVNFDETTRRLSTRLLDRCNLIEFAVDDQLPVLGMRMAKTGANQVEGSPVLQSNRDRWTRNTNVPTRAIEVLAGMQPELNTLGCGLTPRRLSSIYRFVANAESLCSFNEALDMQLRQRILPQIRGRLYRPGAMEALHSLYDNLEKACDVPGTLKALNRLEADAHADDDMFLGKAEA